MQVRRSLILAVFVPVLLGLGLSACSQPTNAANGGRSPATASSSTPAKKHTRARHTKAGHTKARHTKPPAKHKPKHKRPAPPKGPALPQSCFGMISTSAMNRALGKTLHGKTVYIKGIRQPAIDRTGRITCRYGVRGKTIPIEVGVSGYTTKTAAIDRVAVTIRSERTGGAVITSGQVAGRDVTIMQGKHSALLVARDDRRTLAITVQSGYYRGAPTATLRAVAGTVLGNMPMS